jgi:peptide/nickel transport system ATP-binding protein
LSDIVVVEDLHKVFPGRGFRAKPVDAVRGLSFCLSAGKSLGLVGESGSGKTTTARIVCGLETATSGAVLVAGFDLQAVRWPPRSFYAQVQLIFQDPYLSLNPRMSVGQSVEYSLKIRGIGASERRIRARETFGRVGLPATVMDRYPHQLSTGQRQRVGIARALTADPRLIVADEPVSSIDVSLQTQILNLLVDIQEETHVSYLFISHDLAVVGYLCDHVIVMKEGEEVEQGASTQVLTAPTSEYGRLLLEAAGLEAPASSAGSRQALKS